MTSNYNVLYISISRDGSNIEKYEAGDNFHLPDSKFAFYDSKIRRFDGLEIREVYLAMGNICLEFDYNEWFYGKCNKLEAKEDVFSFLLPQIQRELLIGLGVPPQYFD